MPVMTTWNGWVTNREAALMRQAGPGLVPLLAANQCGTCRPLSAVGEIDILVDVRVQAFGDRAVEAGLLDLAAGLGVEGVAFKCDLHLQARHTAGALRHDLEDRAAHRAEVEAALLCVDAHDGDHAGHKRRGQQVGRGKRLATPVVIDRGVGEDGVAGLEMGGFGTQVAQVADGCSIQGKGIS
jgi:hypothetical protein